MKKCLFLVDVQIGFITDKTKHIIERIDKLLSSNYFDYIIASKFINKKDSPFTKYLNWHDLMDDSKTQLYKPIENHASLIVEKNIYTSMNTEVIQFLKSHNINEIYIAGIDTDCCVLATAISFFEIGIRPYVLEYYSASTGGHVSHAAALVVLKRLIGKNSIIGGNLI